MSGAGGGLPGLAVRRPVTVAMSLAALLVVGAIAARDIPRQLLPSGFNAPFMWVSVPCLPAAPADHERTVAEPLENQLATLAGLDRLRTNIRADRVSFRVELKAGVNVDTAYDQIRDRLDRTLPTLPEGSRVGLIWRHDPNEDPVYIVGLRWPKGVDDPSRIIRDRLAQPLERLPGVSGVELWGLQDRALRVELDPGRLRLHGIDTTTLVRQLQRADFSLAVGALEAGGRRVLVRAIARYDDVGAVRALPIAPGLSLGDVATVRFGVDPTPEIHRIDGEPAATLLVFKESTANTVATTARVAARIDALMAGDPNLAGFTADRFFDQGSYIAGSIVQLRDAALIGGLIAVVLLFLFLRSVGMTSLVTGAIPLCLLATLIVLRFTGESLNVMSMMGLMLSVGMVVDNAIVVLENIDRRRRLGEAPMAAAVGGAGEVSLAITLATLTTLVVFLPLILLGDNPYIAFYLSRIGFPVCYALLASLFVALVYIPAAAGRLRSRGAQADSGWLFGWLQGIYTRQLTWVLQHRLAGVLVILAVLASAAIPGDKVERIDQMQGGLDSINVRLYAPTNATFEELDAWVQAAEARLLAEKDRLDVRAVLARKGYSPQQIQLQAFLVDLDARTLDRTTTIDRIKALIPERPGFRVRIGWGGGGSGEAVSEGLTVYVAGPETAVAEELAQELSAFAKGQPGVESAGLEDPDESTELRFEVDRPAAERLGVSPLAVGGALDYTLRGRRLGAWQSQDGEIEMRVELLPEARTDVEQVIHLEVRSDGDAAALASLRRELVPDPQRVGAAPDADLTAAALGQITRRSTAPGYGQIRRYDRKSRVAVKVIGDEQALFQTLRPALAGWRLPTGYALELGERFDRRAKNEEGGLFAVGLAVALVFFLMGVLFESFLLPFSILLSIPLAFVGVLWTLHLTRTPLDVMAIVGCIILVGVVVNNGIVLIDQVQQRRAAGEDRVTALVEGGRQRVRPILMTALTTIGGLVPMAIGHASLLGIEYYPLGRVVIGGLLAGTALTLFAVPLVYSLLDDLSRLPQRTALLRRRAPGPEPSPEPPLA